MSPKLSAIERLGRAAILCSRLISGSIRSAIGAALDAQKPSSPDIGAQKMRPRAMVSWVIARARPLLR